jgi:hypothetical protein
VIWDLLGAAGFVLVLAAIMGVFSRKPRTWGYPPVRKQSTLTGVVVPPPREAAASETEQTVD